jgi:hypothetical protein
LSVQMGMGFMTKMAEHGNGRTWEWQTTLRALISSRDFNYHDLQGNSMQQTSKPWNGSYCNPWRHVLLRRRKLFCPRWRWESIQVSEEVLALLVPALCFVENNPIFALV